MAWRFYPILAKNSDKDGFVHCVSVYDMCDYEESKNRDKVAGLVWEFILRDLSRAGLFVQYLKLPWDFAYANEIASILNAILSMVFGYLVSKLIRFIRRHAWSQKV